jgi:hypothetical protein
VLGDILCLKLCYLFVVRMTFGDDDLEKSVLYKRYPSLFDLGSNGRHYVVFMTL